MIRSSRLIPAVILGAIGLLALKGISWLSGDFRSLSQQFAPSTAVVNPDGSYDPRQFGGIVQMWARAREPYVIPSPETTGSVDKKPTDKPADKPPGTQPEPSIRDRSNVMNTGQRAMSPAERAIVERLGERRDEIEARLRELDMREKLLETAERKLEGRVGELKSQEERLETKAGDQNTAEAQGLKRLVVMYETMRPKDAARVFDRLSVDVLVPVVLQMNPRKMAEVLASMNPEAAEKLTVALASRARPATTAAASPAPAALPANELPAINAPVQQQRR
jgi:flagellar motility protein MotE (MotC chaperone)